MPSNLKLRTDTEKGLEEKQGELKLCTEQESSSRALLPYVHERFLDPGCSRHHWGTGANP